MAYKVYLSDTSSELRDLRPVIIQNIKDWNMTPLWLEDHEKTRPDAVDIARRKIQDADYFIGVVTFKRAWEPEGDSENRSMAEIEYDLAQQLGKPATILLPTPTSELASFLRRRAVGQTVGDTKQQIDFWRRVEQSGQAIFFVDEADLSKKIMDTLRTLERASRVTMETATPPALATPGDQLFAPPAADIDLFADRVAERTANRIQELQQSEQQNLAEQAVKYNEALRLLPGELVFGRPSTASQFKSDIFMIMPFLPTYDYLYQGIMKPLCADLKLTIRRGDEFQSSRGSIMEEVWAALNACRFVIAEISGGNDNVFYELGIAHTLNKPAILITQAKRPEEVPFDVRHLRYLQYDNTMDGGTRLRDSLKTAIQRLIVDLEEGWGPPNGI
jgi:hypothetical protein